jgi:PAS domain S-box-containing protein
MTLIIDGDRYADAFLAAIVENSNDAVVGKLLDGTIISWNAGATRIYGYSATEMIGQSIRKLFPPDRLGEEDEIMESITAGRIVPMKETKRLRKDGGLVDVAITVSPVRDKDGTIFAASNVARDITEALAINRMLVQRESEFRMLADNIAQLAWIAAPDGGITWYNQRWYDFTGTNFDQIKGWGWQSVHRPELVDEITQRFADCVARGVPWEDTFPLRGANGDYRWFLSRAVPIRDEEGHITRWVGTNTDITDRLDAQRRIELLLMEVNHRSKNLLAVVQSLVRQTVAGGGDFVERLEQRIAGLSANQDLYSGARNDRNSAAVPGGGTRANRDRGAGPDDRPLGRGTDCNGVPRNGDQRDQVRRPVDRRGRDSDLLGS